MFDKHRTFILDSASNRRLFMECVNGRRADLTSRLRHGFAVPIRVIVGKQDVYAATASLHTQLKGTNAPSYKMGIRDAAYIVRVWPK